MRNNCLVCGNRLDKSIINFKNMPVGAQIMFNSAEDSSNKTINYNLKRCPICGLNQLDCDEVYYYKSVIRAVGLSDTMKSLRRNDYQYLIDKYNLKNKKWLECGCGNGDFLKVLEEFPVEIYGMENDLNNVETARKQLSKDSHVIHMFTESENAIIPNGPFDVFLSFNFLEHQIDPVTMLKCMHNNLNENGIGLISVPSFEYILSKGYYYEIIRDHIANYDTTSLENLCRICGFEVLEKEYIGIKDTLRFIVRKSNIHDDLIKPQQLDYSSIINSIELFNNKIDEFINSLKKDNTTLAMWGASHQGFTIASSTKLKDYVSYIIDSASFKQGLYAPGSNLLIVPPDYYFNHPVDVILISAPGYIKEIENTIKQLYKDSENGIPIITNILKDTL